MRKAGRAPKRLVIDDDRVFDMRGRPAGELGQAKSAQRQVIERLGNRQVLAARGPDEQRKWHRLGAGDVKDAAQLMLQGLKDRARGVFLVDKLIQRVKA